MTTHLPAVALFLSLIMMITFPGLIAFNTPVDETDAIVASVEPHSTAIVLNTEGVNMGFSDMEFPVAILTVSDENDMDCNTTCTLSVVQPAKSTTKSNIGNKFLTC